MAMTRVQCKQQVKRYLGESQDDGQEGIVTTTDIYNWIGPGQYTVRDLLPEALLQSELAIHTFTTWSTYDTYMASSDLPSTFYRTKGVQVISGSVLKDATPMNWPRLMDEHRNIQSSTIANSGSVYHYCEFGGQMFFVPAPTGSAYLYYLPKPVTPTTDTGSTSYLDMPDGTEDLVCLYIAIQGAIKMGNVNLEQSLTRQFNLNIVNRGGRALIVREEKAAGGKAELALLAGGGGS